MTKAPSRSRRRSTQRAAIAEPRLKMFRAISWREYYSAQHYVSHLLMELGRLGMDIQDIENHSRAPNTETVLSDLIEWLETHPGEAYARLVDWQPLDFGILRARLQNDRNIKPRIEVSVEITKMQNLSVRWYPRGWHGSEFDWDRRERHSVNLITHRKWKESPDFHWFQGDEEPYFDSRPSNELMFIHGVGNLRTGPREDYGPFAKFNSDVVDSILICAVRAAYAALIRQLKLSFDVTVMRDFEFTTRDEVDESDPLTSRFPRHRVVTWAIDSAAAIKERQERKVAIAREQEERAELASLEERVGFSIATLVDVLSKAAVKKKTGPAPSREHINTSAAKTLREAGHQINAGQVRHLRELLARYLPEQLPAVLKPVSAPTPASNVVPFRSEES